MNIRDGWATDYARRSVSFQVDEQDYARWLEEAGVPADAAVPLAIKKRVQRCLAASWVLEDMAEYYERESEPEAAEKARAELKEKQEELGTWASGLKKKFGG